MRMGWPRFSMRVLLVGMLFIGGVLGIVGREIAHLQELARRERAIFEPLEAKGAYVEFHMDVNRSPIEPVLEWAEGRRFPAVRAITLAKSVHQTSEIEAIARLHRLGEFSSLRPECDDSWLAALAKSPSLHSVQIRGDRCTAEGAKALARSSTPLKVVMLYDVPVDDEYLRLIATHPTIEMLAIQGNDVTSAGIGSLKVLPKLSSLFIFGGKNLGDGIAELSHVPHLHGLCLVDYEWNPGDLKALQHLKAARSLIVVSKDMLPAGLLPAAAEMPSLQHLQLQGDLNETEPIDSVTYRRLEKFVANGNEISCAGLLGRLATCPLLKEIEIPRGVVSEAELLELGKLPQLDTFTIGSSPSLIAIKQFQRAKPYCVYIDGELGVIQPLLGINPAKMGRGVNQASIIAPAPSSGT